VFYLCLNIVNTSALKRTFKEGSKIIAKSVAKHSPQRKINSTCTNGSVNVLSTVVNFLAVAFFLVVVDAIRDVEMANEVLPEKLRCANLLLMQCRGCT
jgi:hypothetical protein